MVSAAKARGCYPPVRQCTKPANAVVGACGGVPRGAGLVSLLDLADACSLEANRLVRTRMLGGVGGVPEQSGPLSRSLVIRNCELQSARFASSINLEPTV